MRDKKRIEKNLLEQAYSSVYKEELLHENPIAMKGALKTGGMKAAGSGALTGAGLGATVGSIVPGVGTAIGAGVGGAVGGNIGAMKNAAADEEVPGGGSADIATIAAQAIAAIAQLASAAGANISVAVEIGEEEIQGVEVIDQFNTGYEDVEST